MSKKGKREIVPLAFELPEGLDDKLNVIPSDLLQAIVDVLGQQPASATRQVLNGVEHFQKEGKILGIAEYLTKLDEDARSD